MRISVVIPVLNEVMLLRRCIKNVRRVLFAPEVIVIDGGSCDGTARIAQEQNVIVGRSGQGRGRQCNAGAAFASGEIIVFLHADTTLPDDACEQIARSFLNPAVKVATFRLAFDHRHWLLKSYSYFTKFDSVFTRFGDQGIIVRKSFFVSIGGFPDWPLFEDVCFLQKARRQTKIRSLPAAVVTSARRFLDNGFLRQQLKNGWYLLQYIWGVSPERLALKYFHAGPLPVRILKKVQGRLLLLQAQVSELSKDKKAKYFSIKPLVDHWNVKRPFSWQELFGNSNPVDVEIGCGLGEFLSRTALVSSGRNFVGIEREWKRLVKTMRKIKTSRLENVRVLRVDAVVAFERLFAPSSIGKVYCLFPCPWPKKRHVRHRLFSKTFLRLLNNRLTAKGEVLIVTDYEPYVDWIREHLRATGFKIAERMIEPKFDTKFERKWRAAGQSDFFEMRLTKQRHVSFPLKEDQKVKKFYEKEFAPEHFQMEDSKGKFTVVFKEFLFDSARQRGMVRTLVAEENLTQSVWVNIEKAGDKWRIALPEGQNIFPTAGVAKAIELVAKAAKASVAGVKI